METTKKKFHYGWVIAILSLLMVVCSSLWSTGMSITLSGVRETYGLSGTDISMVITVRSLAAFLIVLIFDKWYKLFGLRKGTALGIFIGAVGMLINAFAADNLVMYYIAAVLGGITYGLCLTAAAAMLVKNWFNKQRIFFLAVCSAGTGISGMIFSPILQAIINNSGMKSVFIFETVLFAVVALLMLLLLRDKPSEMGLEPFGGKDYDPSQDAKKKNNDGKKEEKKNNKVFLGSGSILIMSLFLVGLGLSASPASSQMALAFNAAGFDPMTVAYVVSFSGLCLIIGKLSYGLVADKFGHKKTAVIYTIIICVGFAAVFGAMWIPENFMMIIGYAAWGIGGAVATLGYPVWAMDFSSDEDYPKTLKKFQLGYQLGGLIGSPLPGIIFDATGSYFWFFIIPILGYGGMTLCAMLLYRKLKKARIAAGEPV